MSLLQHELVHLLLSSLVTLFIWLRFGKGKPRKPILFGNITNIQLLITSIFIVGIFLDVDHLFDYFMWSKGTFILKDFLNPSLYVHQSGKVYVPFHGFEFIPIIWLVAKYLERKFALPALALAVTLSYVVHLFWDNFSFSHAPLAYSIIYRLLNRFSVGSFDGF